MPSYKIQFARSVAAPIIVLWHSLATCKHQSRALTANVEPALDAAGILQLHLRPSCANRARNPGRGDEVSSPRHNRSGTDHTNLLPPPPPPSDLSLGNDTAERPRRGTTHSSATRFTRKHAASFSLSLPSRVCDTRVTREGYTLPERSETLWRTHEGDPANVVKLAGHTPRTRTHFRDAERTRANAKHTRRRTNSYWTDWTASERRGRLCSSRCAERLQSVSPSFSFSLFLSHPLTLAPPLSLRFPPAPIALARSFRSRCQVAGPFSPPLASRLSRARASRVIIVDRCHSINRPLWSRIARRVCRFNAEVWSRSQLWKYTWGSFSRRVANTAIRWSCRATCVNDDVWADWTFFDWMSRYYVIRLVIATFTRNINGDWLSVLIWLYVNNNMGCFKNKDFPACCKYMCITNIIICMYVYWNRIFLN